MTRCSLLTAVFAISALAVTLQANTLLNENFNELTPGGTQTSIGAFTAIDGTNVDVLGGAFFAGLCAAPTSGDCIDMDGSGGDPQGVLQSAAITVNPGVDYFLSFDLLGSQRGNTASTTVTFGSYSQTFTLTDGDDSSGVVTDRLVTVASTTSTFLTFSSDTPGDEGNILDNVLITSSPAAPEPSVSVLAGLGLLGLGFVAFRRGRLLV